MLDEYDEKEKIKSDFYENINILNEIESCLLTVRKTGIGEVENDFNRLDSEYKVNIKHFL